MKRPYVTLDVFTATRFAGNPLAVVFDAEGLDTPRMQAIAREFNLSETVFLSAPREAAHAAAMRIFTAVRELPFAGHPTVGTAVLLAVRKGAGEGDIVLEQAIGPVACATRTDRADRGHASFRVPRLPVQDGFPEDTSLIAQALGLSPYDIGFDQFAPTRFNAGNPFTFVPLRGLEAMSRIRVDAEKWNRAFLIDGHSGAYVYCRETVDDDHAFHARMFAPSMGIAEDPATGSAVAGFAGVLTSFEPLGDGEHAYAIEQGYEMGRPSVIHLTITTRARALRAARIAGDAVIVSEGTFSA